MIVDAIKNFKINRLFEVILNTESRNDIKELFKETIRVVINRRTVGFAIMATITYSHLTYLPTKPYYKKAFIKTYKKIKDYLFREPPEDLELVDKFFECQFFDADQVECRKHVVAREPCELKQCAYYKLKYLLAILDSATETIDLCMYLITCTDLAQALIAAHRRGVKVRVIVEEEMSTSSESKVQQLLTAGITVKSKVLSTFMHHKFCLIDATVPYKRKLLTGSLNWTLQGLAGNWENVILVKHKRLVLNFLDEFNLIWDYFEVKKLKTDELNEKKPRRPYDETDEEF